MNRRHALQGLGAAGVALAAPGRLLADESVDAFPTRRVRVISTFSAGSGPDAAMRLVADGLGRRWRQPVVVDNRPGGNGLVGISAFRQVKPDGYDLGLMDSAMTTINPHVFGKVPYDMDRDFVPLRMILHTPFFVAVRAQSPYRSISELLDAARKRPGEMTYASWGVGSAGHVGALRLLDRTGTQMVHVAFREYSQMFGAVANGDVDWTLCSAASGHAMATAGKIRYLMLSAPKRSALYPDVPCSHEVAGLEGFEAIGWVGLFAPAGIAPALRDRLSAQIAAVLASDEVTTQYSTLGYATPPLSPTDFAALIRRESAQWKQLVDTAGLKLDPS